MIYIPSYDNEPDVYIPIPDTFEPAPQTPVYDPNAPFTQPQINVQPVGGIVNDFEQPTFPVQTGAERGATLTDIHAENPVQPQAPLTIANPADDFVGYAPYTRDFYERQTTGVIGCNVKPQPVTQLEKSQTQFVPDALQDTPIDTTPKWNISGLSWSGVAVVALLVAAGWYAWKGGA